MTAEKDEIKPASTLLVLPREGGRLSALRRVLRRVPWNYVGPILSIALFVGALVVLASLLRTVKPDEVVAGFTATPALAIALSIVFTACSYLALTGYDALALRHLHELGHRKIAFMRGPRAIPDSEFRWEGIAEAAQTLEVAGNYAINQGVTLSGTNTYAGGNNIQANGAANSVGTVTNGVTGNAGIVTLNNSGAAEVPYLLRSPAKLKLPNSSVNINADLAAVFIL